MVTCTIHPLSLDWTEANAKEQGRGAASGVRFWRGFALPRLNSASFLLACAYRYRRALRERIAWRRPKASPSKPCHPEPSSFILVRTRCGACQRIPTPDRKQRC